MQYLHASFDNISSECGTAGVELAELVRAKMQNGQFYISSNLDLTRDLLRKNEVCLRTVSQIPFKHCLVRLAAGIGLGVSVMGGEGH